MAKSNEQKKINKADISTKNKNSIKPAAFFTSPQGKNGNCAMAGSNCIPSKTQEMAEVVNSDNLNNILINLNRSLFAALIVFEVLNTLGILHYLVGFHWIALTITTGGSWILLEAIFYYTKKSSSQIVSNLLMLAAVLALYSDTLGQVFYLFDRVIWYDQVLHFFAGGVLCSIIIFLLIKSLEYHDKIRLGNLGIAFTTLATTVFLGLLYEFGEFVLDSITGSNSLVSLSDTINDLLLDTLGSLSVLTILVVYFNYVSRRSRSANKNSSTTGANT